MVKAQSKQVGKSNEAKILGFDDVIKSSNAKEALNHSNLGRFKFRIGDINNSNAVTYKKVASDLVNEFRKGQFDGKDFKFHSDVFAVLKAQIKAK